MLREMGVQPASNGVGVLPYLRMYDDTQGLSVIIRLNPVSWYNDLARTRCCAILGHDRQPSTERLIALPYGTIFCPVCEGATARKVCL